MKKEMALEKKKKKIGGLEHARSHAARDRPLNLFIAP